MDKLAKHGHQANKAALYGELCALLFAKSHYDEVCMVLLCFLRCRLDAEKTLTAVCLPGLQVVYRSYERN